MISTFKRVFLSFMTLSFIFSISAFSKEHPFLVSEELLNMIQNEVSGERAWDMVSKISRFHRIRGGGEGSDYNQCVEWLAEELKKLGVKDVNIKKYRSDGVKKYFLWNSPVGWRVNEAELWLLEPKEKLLARFSDQAVSLMPYSQRGEVESEVIFVGQGKSDEDYKDKDIKGKLVFALGGDGYEVHRHAVIKRGAKGILVGPSDREDRIRFADLIELYRLSPTGEEKNKTGFGFSLSRRQAREILSYFEEGKKVKMRARVDAELFDGNMPILEAKFVGNKYPHQEIIIMGHLDHYKPGANDNASGSAGLVEIARNIASLVKRGDIPTPKRTIRLLWLPEMHGTAAYLSEHQELSEKGIAGMNLDMIGEDYILCETNFNLKSSPYSVPGYINDVLINLIGWLEDQEFFSPRGKRYKLNYRVRPFSGGSDHIMFNDSAFSIPSVMLGHGDVFHHTNFDTPDKCDPTEMKRVISLALATGLFLANADDEQALQIAREVYSQANLRIMKRTLRSIQSLHLKAANREMEKMAELYSNCLLYPRVQAEIESANLDEVKELCKEKISYKIIDELKEDLLRIATAEELRIKSLNKLFLHQYKLEGTSFPINNLYKKASRLKPVRLFEGPLLLNYLRDALGEETFSWYRKNREKIGRNYGAKTYEIINLMDGKRSLLDIRHIISCEFDETGIDFVLRFVEDLEKAGLIRF